MRKFYSLSLLYCVLALVPVVAVAQITITAADVATQLGVGNVITRVTDTVTTFANIGTLGSTSWDFSGLLTHTSTVLTSVAPASTPFNADFPAATHALKTTLSGAIPGAPGPVTGDLYVYLTLGTNLEAPGSKGSGTATVPPFGTLPGIITITNVIPDTTYALPSTHGTMWKTINSTTTAIVLGDPPTLPLTPTIVNHDITYTVDAFGPMTLPGGGTHDALRVRKVENFGPQTIGYIFLAKNGASVQFTALDNLQPDNGVISLQRSTITWTGPTFILPIQLSYFHASLDAAASRVLVQWKTVSELNNFGFEVQKASSLHSEYMTIANGFIPGHGTTNVPYEYSCVDQSISVGAWYYRLKQVDLDGSSTLTDPIMVNITTGVAEGAAPATFLLGQNYPNPFNPSTTISYGLPYRASVSLVVYNSLGQLMATLVDGEVGPGYHDVQFDASALSSGVYFYRLQAGAFVETKKLTLLR